MIYNIYSIRKISVVLRTFAILSLQINITYFNIDMPCRAHIYLVFRWSINPRILPIDLFFYLIFLQRKNTSILYLMNAVYNMKTLCLDRPNYQDFCIIVLFVLKLIASTIDIYPLLPPYKASERKDHKTGYQQSKLSGIWAAFPNNCPYRIVMC